MRKLGAGIVGALILALAVVVAHAQEKAAAPKSTTTSTSTKAPTSTSTKASTSTSTKASSSTSTKASSSASATGPRSIIGEVIDPACWVINGAKGEAHKECAIACSKAGQTLAILERKTNKVYILASERPGEDPNKPVADYIAQAVLVKGKVYSRGGLMAIQVASVEPAPKNAPK